MIRFPLTCLAVICAAPAVAQVPSVLTDIAPVHSLVAQVMDGLGAPDLLVPPGSDAHTLALRPSDARRLQDAGIVVQVGPELTPWLQEPLAGMADRTTVLTLLETPGWSPRMFGDDTAGGADRGHRDTADAAGAQGGDAHDAGPDNHAVHGHHGIDPHAWLDPQAAVAWVAAIRDTLIETDPQNAGIYTSNADDATARLLSLETEIADALPDTIRGRWLAPHDALGYFEDRFDVRSAGSVADSEAVAPGPARLGVLRGMVEDGTVTCVLTEAGDTANRARTLTAGTDARQAMLDPTGAGLTPGPDLYGTLLRGIARTLADCTTP